MSTAKIQFVCEYCTKPFERVCFPSSNPRRFCSVKCRNTVNAHNKERILGKKCPKCGHIGRRQSDLCKSCGGQPVVSNKNAVKRTSVIWTPKLENYIRRHYPERGALYVADKLQIPIGSVRCRAAKLNVKLSPSGVKNVVNNAARKYMSRANPMKRPEVKQKIQDWRAANPEIAETIHAALTEGHARIEREKPSGLERKLHTILDGLNVKYESSVIIKPRFVVDTRIGSVIIQADGDYWHGHPRFAPLTERQQKQQARDRSHDAYLKKSGYHVERIWECEMCESKVLEILSAHKIKTPLAHSQT